MAMNYVGSISILDRGDAPAQAVIDRNARSFAQRAADETREELQKVMHRVDNIYGNFELSTTIFETGQAANMEYVNDLAELEGLLQDSVKKRKYQQQVTIFIVGFENICGQKLRLLQQVNDFFMENIQQMEDEELNPPTPDIDMDEVSDAVEESLQTAHDLAGKLNDINAEIKDYLISYANAKATNKGKKKLEKALQQAKEDIGVLSEKLMAAQQEIEEKEDKMQTLFKQIEMKNMESQRYRTVAEVAKKTVGDSDSLKDEIFKRDELIRDLKHQIDKLMLDVGQAHHTREQSTMRMRSDMEQKSNKLEQMEKNMEDKRAEFEGEKRQLMRLHENQMEGMRETHRQEVEEIRRQHGLEIKRLLASRSVSELDKEGDEDRSRPTTKDTSRGSRQENRAGQQKPAASKPGNKQGLKSQQKGKNTKQKGKEYSEIAVQDEGGDPDSATVENGGPARNGKNKTSLEPVQEADLIEFDDSFDLQDEESWACVPASHVPGRFVQYRNITKKRLSDLEEQLDVTITKTSRKVQTLKAQFQEHKTKWAAEREMLITQVEQAQKLQGAAETEANAAMDQLEDFINEQEELEQEEDDKRRELDQTETSVKDAVVAAAKDKLEQKLKEQQAQQQQEKEEEEMRKRLLQQTDDAKLEREKTLTEGSQQSDSEGTEGVKATSLPQSPKLEVKSQSGSTVVSPIPPMSAGRESVSPGPSSLPVTPKADEEVPYKPGRASSHTLMVPDGRASVQSSRSLRSPEGQAQELLSRQGSHIDSGKSLSEGRSALSLRDGSIEGDTHEAIRLSSAQSRASLRSVHRSTLSARRTAFEGRRSKSPALSLRSQKSVLSDAELDEDADLPFPDDVKEENQKSATSRHDIGTSPPPKELTKTSLYSSKSPDIPDIKEEDEEEVETEARNDLLLEEERKSIPMSEHPVVQEYLKTYEHIISFKDALSKLLMDKDVMSASQVLTDMEPYPFSKEDRIIPQIEDMTRNAKTMLQETAGLLTGILHMEQDYPVSSLVGLSRDNTRTNLTMREKTPESMAHRAHVKSRTTQWSAKSSGSSTAQNLKDLQDQYAVLQHRLQDETKKHADQLNHNTVVMMEMQDTINALQRELQALKASTAEGQSESRGSTPVMFTRLDSERNAKILKRAVNEQRLDSGRYQDAVEKMEDYISLPAKRLAQLVKKYVHHCHMKQIEENVRNSRSLNDNVFMTLDKMEALQNVRARRWADHMDNLGSERMKLAQILMDTLDNIEQESGLFLIKPMFSYRPNISPDGYLTKLSRGFRARENLNSKSQTTRGTAAYPPTPSSHIKALQVTQSYGGEDPRTFSTITQQNASGLVGKSQVLVGDYPRPVWNPSVATGRPLTSENKHLLNSHLNTPRILELDINRMLIGQNQVSTHVPPFLATDDRLVNAANTSVRSYVTVNRPVGLTSGPDRPRSHTGISEHSVPPSTPQQRAGSGSITQQRSPAFSIEDVPKSLTNTPPLPPIGTKEDAPFPPRSPPGSSLRQSPPYALSGASSPANKPGVRTMSQLSGGLQATI